MQPGWVYYLRVADQIKIGYTIDVRDRMKSYPPTSELLAVHPGTTGLEREMHQQFSALRMHGREWFRVAPDLLAHIERVIQDFGPVPKGFRYRFREQGAQQMRPRG